LLLREIGQFIRSRVLIPEGSGVLVAVSGGVDSVVLLHVLSRLANKHRWRLAVGHVNHAMRGEAADEDEAFVRDLAATLKLPFRSVRLDPELWKSPGNKQEKARRERYRWLRTWAKEERCESIATAHQADDQAETELDRLIRGTGLDGLGGIPVRQGCIVRPLLETPRAAILDYAQFKKLAWREDATNAALAYTRSRIRHEVLPVLETLRAGAAERIAQATERLAEAGEALRAAAAILLQQNLTQGVGAEWRVDTERLLSLPIGLRLAIWREALRLMRGGALRRISAAHCYAIDHLATSNAMGPVALPDDGRVERAGGTLIFYPSPEDNGASYEFELDIPGDVAFPGGSLMSWRASEGEELVFTDPNQAYFDAEAMGEAIVVRSRRAGDWIALPKVGRKSVARLFSDLKVPHSHRDRIPLVVSSVGVLWAPGLRRSQLAMVTEKNHRIVGMKFCRKLSK